MTIDSTWNVTVRFPGAMTGKLQDVLGLLNSRPDSPGKVSQNDLIVFAVQRVIRDLMAEESARTGPCGGSE